MLTRPTSTDRNAREQQRAEREEARIQTIVNSRLVIEQAKGVVAERRHISIPAAFDLLRAYARDRNQPLHDVCATVVADADACAARRRGSA